MRRLLAGLFLASLLIPVTAAATAAPVSRRDGFLIVWQSIRRSVEKNHEKPFGDVPSGSTGFDEITYAKYRGILDDTDLDFHPGDPLLLQDALLWLFRTRSVDDLSKLTVDTLPALLVRYPIGEFTQEVQVDGKPKTTIINRTVTQDELTSMMRTLDDELAKEVHEVSLYGEDFQGQGTAFGEIFNMNDLTAAHRTFPYNTLVEVTNTENGKTVTVRINDRGPYVAGRDMDLSVAAFTSIADRREGVIHATFRRLGDAALVGQCGAPDLRRQIRITRDVRLIGGIPLTLPLGQSLTLRSTASFVLRSIGYPDGTVSSVQDWVLPGESHPFTPSIPGEYVFLLGTKDGRQREMRMTAVSCHS